MPPMSVGCAVAKPSGTLLVEGAIMVRPNARRFSDEATPFVYPTCREDKLQTRFVTVGQIVAKDVVILVGFRRG